MEHFYFIENETGEEFLVCADRLVDAWITAKEIASEIAEQYGVYPNLTFEYIMDEEEAESSGLDEY